MPSLDAAPLVLKANNSADLLAMIPSIAGFEPRNSLVLVAFRGKRSCAAIRFDLPASNSKTVLKRFATFAVGTICKLREVNAVVAALYVDESVGSSSRLPHADYADVVGRRLRQSGFELRELLCQAADAWGSYLDDHHPVGGRPLAEVIGSPVLAKVPAMWLPRRSLDGPSRVPDADVEVRARFAAQLVEARGVLAEVRTTLDEARTEGAGDGEVEPETLVPWSNLTEFFEAALEWDKKLIEIWGATLLLTVQGPPVRDAAMLQWAFDARVGEISLEQSSQFNQGNWIVGHPATREEAAIEQLVGDLMLGIGPRPDPRRIEAGISLLLLLVSRAEDSERPAPLCMLGWLSWALGRGSEGGRYIAEVRRIDPAYGMGQVLDTIFSNGILPEWAFRDEPVSLS